MASFVRDSLSSTSSKHIVSSTARGTASTRYRRILLHACVLYAVTFVVVLPVFYYDQTFSFYYKLRRLDNSLIFKQLIEKRYLETQSAMEYFVNSTDNNKGPLTGLSKEKPYTPPTPWIVVGIVTVKREVKDKKYKSFQPKYVIETAARLVQVLETANGELRSRIKIFICNAEVIPEDNEAAAYLSAYIPTIKRTGGKANTPNIDAHKREQLDYSFCLRRMAEFGSQYTLILQDDVLVHWNFFQTLNHILTYKIEYKYERGDLIKQNNDNLAFIKLYYPEKWLGYSWGFPQLLELFALACLGGPLLAYIYGSIFDKCNTTDKCGTRILILGIFMLYVILVAESIGRSNLMLIRRIDPNLYYTQSAPRCCMPAQMYTRHNIYKFIEFLESADLKCSKKYPLDIAIAEFSETSNMDAVLVLPSMVDHIGTFSTLNTKPKNPQTYFRNR
ncbi:GPI-N-acetylgalactosamine transferase PGAP4-like [Saccoglossus kowalevskii]